MSLLMRILGGDRELADGFARFVIGGWAILIGGGILLVVLYVLLILILWGFG